MEGLCSRRQAAHDDAAGNGVLAPLLPARAAQGLRENPVFWFPREPIPRASASRSASNCWRAIARRPASPSEATSNWHCPNCGAAMIVIQRLTAAELSTVHLLRHLLDAANNGGPLRRASRTPAHSCARTFTESRSHSSFPYALSSNNFSVIATVFGDPTRRLSGSSGHSPQLAARYKSGHSIPIATRPPQTPAASF